MPSGPPEGYVEVADRITAFYAKYPDGSLRCKAMRLEEVEGVGTFLVYVAQAYRTPDDLAPAEGAAWEPVPGKTNFTRDSELMNAETSAWGRAIAALGFEVKQGIASANEVRNRQDGEQKTRSASDKQLDYIASLSKGLGADAHDESLIRGFAATLPIGRVSNAIERLKAKDADFLNGFAEEAQVWQAKQSDAPPDVEGLEQQPLDESGVPWEPAKT